jgi:hypothetical protein
MLVTNGPVSEYCRTHEFYPRSACKCGGPRRAAEVRYWVLGRRGHVAILPMERGKKFILV